MGPHMSPHDIRRSWIDGWQSIAIQQHNEDDLRSNTQDPSHF